MLCLKLCFAGTASDSIRYNTSIRDIFGNTKNYGVGEEDMELIGNFS